MAFKVQDGFQNNGSNKNVSGKIDSFYISEVGSVGAASITPVTATFDFTTGSVPSNWDHQQMNNTTTKFTDATYGNYFLSRGDANDKSQYPLRSTYTFSDDYLFQLSFFAGNNPTYQDWGMALSTTSYSNRTQNHSATGDIPWKWRWGSNADTGTFTHKRIAVQCNGDNATIYPNSNSNSQAATGSTVDTIGGSSGAFFTLHFQHRPSTGQTKTKVTTGSKDWTASGTQSGGAVILNETLGAGNNYWWGIASDNDDSSYFTKSDGARYTNNTSEFF
tara:strand:+ start:818 stop:1645 length:828 start_codon:yes stop_codon:yes gene_type:complete